MLLSIIIPTRNRTRGLWKCCESIRKTTGRNPEIEIILKIDHDDNATKAELDHLERNFSVRTMYSYRGVGYDDMGRFFDEGNYIASGKWVMMMDDDSYLDGNGWDRKLAAIDVNGRNVAQPEYYKLGLSNYGSGSCGPSALIIPRNSWILEGEPIVRVPTDAFFQGLLVHTKHYKVNWLRGLTYCHDRVTPPEKINE